MGLSCYSFSLLLWMYVLSQNDLSYARPFAGLGYIFTAVFASIFFRTAVAGSIGRYSYDFGRSFSGCQNRIED